MKVYKYVDTQQNMPYNIYISNEAYITTDKTMKQQTRIKREWQVRDEDGCLDHFPATVAGLKQAVAAYNAAVEAFAGDMDNEDDAPRLELYEQNQSRWDSEDDWEQDWAEHYQTSERMPTKALQKMIDKHL